MPAVRLEPVVADSRAAVTAAQDLAVTGYPVIGEPLEAAKVFGGEEIVTLLAVAGTTIVGVASLDTSRPSKRIPSARLFAVAVSRAVEADAIGKVAEFLIYCAPLLIESGVVAAGRRGGYVVADVHTDNTYAALLADAGWEALPQPADSPTARFIKYLENRDASQSRQSESWT